MPRLSLWTIVVAGGWLLSIGAFSRSAPGIEDVGSALTLTIGPMEGTVTLTGPDDRQQLIVTSTSSDGRLRDVTRNVRFAIRSPDGEAPAVVSEDGQIRPVADGEGLLTVTDNAGRSASLPVRVTGFDQVLPIHFQNQVVPIFTKLGCNGGGCHGKSGGQNGFRLSLLGFYPEDDYEFLVKEGRGRRLFPFAPDESLLLKKATGEMPHGGGARLAADSDEYRLIRRWIEQGMPYGGSSDAVVTGIECLPRSRIMDRQSQQQVTVRATYSDGRTQDVTRMALFEPNNPDLAEVSPTGLVRTTSLTGEVAIMARYQGQVSTFRATIPLGIQLAEMPPVRNVVDEAVFARLRLLGIPPSPVCDDATFLRRVSIDITGTLPTAADVVRFVSDPSPEKRDQLINELLERPEYADHFATKWNAVLRNKRRQDEDLPGTYAFRHWIWQALYENRPYDEFVRDIVTATGDVDSHPPVVWYREVDDTTQQVEDAAQLFLGVRIQCARCHHHPFERWSQDDYHSLAAFFSRVSRKTMPVGLGLSTRTRDRRLYHNEGVPRQTNPRTGQALPPAGLGGPPLSISPEEDPRAALVDWMRAPDNRFFARSLANRYWKHFFGRGIVEPEDDLRETNPPSNPELLEALAEQFVASGFDLKELVRTICQSTTYQLSSLPNEHNLTDRQNFSRHYPQRLTAEVLYDGFHQVVGMPPHIGELPVDMRASQLADHTVAPYFLKVFGQPQADTACECERSQDASLAQSLHLLNSKDVQEKIARFPGRAYVLSVDERPAEEKVRELYRWVYAREPDASELEVATGHIARHSDAPRTAYEDLVWALINTREFLFNH
jgi:hypothetical protein